jgi:hypothetical protein
LLTLFPVLFLQQLLRWLLVCILIGGRIAGSRGAEIDSNGAESDQNNNSVNESAVPDVEVRWLTFSWYLSPPAPL